MGHITILILAFVSFVAISEGTKTCNGYYYKACYRSHYKKNRLTYDCGWYRPDCVQYTMSKVESYYQCTKKCPPVNGGYTSWNNWTSWGSCSKSCGDGTQTRNRYRTCNNPSARNGGKACIGLPANSEGRACKKQNCEIDGGWTNYGEWSNWTKCSTSCGTGLQQSTRSRSCTNPEPKFNGQSCTGEKTEERTQECKLKNCIATCECSTVGDTHYKTFDGEWIHFLGMCKFQLAKSHNDTECPFSVVITNNAGSQTSQLPYARTIEFTVKGYKINLLQNKNVLVDGVKVHLPYSSSNKTFDIFMSGRYVRVQTNCSIVLEWDGAMNMELAVQNTYARHMTGICGDCGGEKKVTNDKSSTIAYRFALEDKAQEAGITCSPIIEVPTAGDRAVNMASSDKFCGRLLSKEFGNSPFQKCLEKIGIASDEQFTMCVTDVSLYLYYGIGDKHIEKAICNNLESFALQCAEIGIPVDWRSDELCPLTCGTNQIYSDQVSGCQANCVNPDSEKSCHLPFTEGCACKEGHVLSGDECVKVEDCGCSSKVGYIALGEEILTQDCTERYTCIKSNGTAKANTDVHNKCHNNAVCQLNDDSENICKCKKGYQGDGIKECKADDSMPATIEDLPSGDTAEDLMPPPPIDDLTSGDTAEDLMPPPIDDLTSGDTAAVAEKECKLTKSGINYKGKISKTASGIVCQEWAKAEPHGHRFTTKLAADSNHCRNPDNSATPWCYTMNEKKRWEYCSIPDCEITDCRTDSKGTNYNGQKSTTKSGIVCQSWGTSTPHKHSFKTLAAEQNYCRNPDGSRRPWCYTVDPTKRWEFCDIPSCVPEEIKECLTEAKGNDYNGNKNTTTSGLTCQAWGSNTPHKHRFGSLDDALNNCRNPDGSGRPWCYTMDSKKRWQYCDIPLC